jgi:hypothetical protein
MRWIAFTQLVTPYQEFSLMEQQKPAGKKKLKERYEAFVDHQNHCPLCGTQLTIKVETYADDFQLREEAHCSSCDLLARIKDHNLH